MPSECSALLVTDLSVLPVSVWLGYFSLFRSDELIMKTLDFVWVQVATRSAFYQISCFSDYIKV